MKSRAEGQQLDSLASRAPPNPTDSDDAALVAQARSDRREFAALYDRYVSLIYRYCLVRLGNRQEAEDVTSEVFLKAFTRLDSFRGQNFSAWLYRIAHNAVVDRLRSRRQHAPLDDIQLTGTSEQGAQNRVEQELLRQHVSALPEDQRSVVELRLAGWTDRRTAEALGKSVDAVKKLHFRAVRRLRGQILNRGARKGDPDA